MKHSYLNFALVASSVIAVAQASSKEELHNPLQSVNKKEVHASPSVSSVIKTDETIDVRKRDDTAALQEVEEFNRQKLEPQTIWLDPGQFTLKSTVFNPSGSMWIVPPGSAVSGGLIEGNTDGAMITPGHQALGIITNSVRPGGAALFISNTTGKDTHYPSYEVDGLYVNVATADSSNIMNHDIVAGHLAAQIIPGNKSGRAWGQDVTVTIPRSADGYAVGAEISVDNDSGTTGKYGEKNAKFGIGLLAAGHNDTTAAILLHDAGAKFLDGVLEQNPINLVHILLR